MFYYPYAIFLLTFWTDKQIKNNQCLISRKSSPEKKRSPCDIVVKVLTSDIVVKKFKHQSCYYVHFLMNVLGKNMNSHKPSAIGSSVGWDCKIHWLCPSRGIRLPQWVSCNRHKIIWWSSSKVGTLGNVEYFSVLSIPGLFWPKVVATDRVLSMDQIELIDI